MKSALLFLALVVVVLAEEEVTVLKAGTKNCTVDDLKEAQIAFAKRLNINEKNDWTNPIQLLRSLHDFYAGDGINGILDVCNALNAELDTLNNKDVDPKTCFNPQFLILNDDTPEHALYYISILGYLRFQCGAGFYTAAQNWQCISDTYKSSKDTLSGILENVIYDTRRSKKNHVDLCRSVKKDEKYFVKQFQDKCNNYQTNYFACESYNQFFGIVYPACLSECQVQRY